MSRLYDALKEASRFRGANRNGKEGLWSAWGIQGIEIPPVPEGPEALDEEQPAVALPEEPDAASVEELLEATEFPLNGAVLNGASLNGAALNGAAVNGAPSSLGTPTRAAMDAKARLIPHAVNPTIVEYYRRLRTKILQKQEERPFRSLVVTSANPQEGKTVTSLNLGLSFAMLPSYKVLVVDGDLRRGTLGSWLGVDSRQPGLSNLIDGSAKLEDVILKSDAIPMRFMVRGNSQAPDIHASQLSALFQKMTDRFDLVIVDSPPINLLADVQLLAGSCEAVLLIARAFSTTRQALEKAVQDLQPFNVIGSVLNAGTAQRSRRYYGYY